MNLPFDLLVAVTFLLMICVLIAAHELGHYLFARLFKMGVEEFCIGFGPKPILTLWRRPYTVQLTDEDRVRFAEAHPGEPVPTEIQEETKYTIRPIPLGGFVKIKGLAPEEDGSEVNVPGGFFSRPPLQRLVVFFAGPLFSVAFGILILTGLYTTVGQNLPDKRPILGDMSTGPAQAAGLKSGDRIVSVDGAPMNTFYQLIGVIQDSPQKALKVVYVRKGETLQTTLTPEIGDVPIFKPDLTSEGRHRAGRIGAQFAWKTVPVPLGQAAVEAAMVPVEAVAGIGHLFKKPSDFSNNVGGPATIVAVTASATKSGIPDVLQLAGLLSISLGIMNLLPFPPLDGGQMVIAFVELLRRGKRLSIQVQSVAVSIGIAAVLILVVGVLAVDFGRFMPGGAKPAKAAHTK